MRQSTLANFLGVREPTAGVLPDGYLVVDLFCSVGGVSIGASQLGHRVVLAVDFDQSRLDVHACNHPFARHECMKVGPETQNRLIAMIDAVVPHDQRHRLWIHLSPPCQGQSQMRALGKRKASNVDVAHRDEIKQHKQMGLDLVSWCLDFVCMLQPAQFSIEEVSDTKGCVKRLMAETRAKHRSFFDFDNFDMSLYGVPQTRSRLICGRPETIRRLRLDNSLKVSKRRGVEDVMRIPEGARFVQGLISRPLSPEKVHAVAGNPGKYTDGMVDLFEPHLPSPTCGSRPFTWIADHPYHRIRLMSPGEIGALCTFPPNFRWPAAATVQLKYDGYGNAVPPLFVQKLMRAAEGEYTPATGIGDPLTPSRLWRPPSAPEPS